VIINISSIFPQIKEELYLPQYCGPHHNYLLSSLRPWLPQRKCIVGAATGRSGAWAGAAAWLGVVSATGAVLGPRLDAVVAGAGAAALGAVVAGVGSVAAAGCGGGWSRGRGAGYGGGQGRGSGAAGCSSAGARLGAVGAVAEAGHRSARGRIWRAVEADGRSVRNLGSNRVDQWGFNFNIWE
jgi:hypothetical protein